ncbi:ran-specific GTPase-activating protein-like [Schistocerca cancellata]|uniref:ran-specific GTPase-activating protein-like n=1 Tax=Schistocerca cancellata TaxID=274614 RepID=UPI002117D88E|nr:ran-specific GTPase-activating protein-like [Schistocerca cancellata]
MSEDHGDHKETTEETAPDEAVQEHDPHFEPIVTLPEVKIRTMEEDEVEMIKMRAKLFRYDKSESPPEWKERGTGEVKLLRHITKNTVRVVMRRDKTLKLCANHFVTPWMDLKPNCGSNRSWVYSVDAEFADGEVKKELLAMMFANPENAKKWKEKFEEAKMIVETQLNKSSSGNESNDQINTENNQSDENESDESQEICVAEDENLNEKLEQLKVADEKTADTKLEKPEVAEGETAK